MYPGAATLFSTPLPQAMRFPNVFFRPATPVLLFLSLALTAFGNSTKVHDAIVKGIVTGTMIETLVDDDVPEDWRALKSVSTTDSSTVVTYKRKGQKVIEVTWAKRWVEKKSEWFACNAFVEGKSVAKIMRVGDSVIVLPTKELEGIMVVTTVKDDRHLSVGLVRKDGTIIDSIVVNNRDTHLMDDLEYTKGMLAVEMVVKPLMKTMAEGLHEAVEAKISGQEQTRAEDSDTKRLETIRTAFKDELTAMLSYSAALKKGFAVDSKAMEAARRFFSKADLLGLHWTSIEELLNKQPRSEGIPDSLTFMYSNGEMAEIRRIHFNRAGSATMIEQILSQ